MVRAAGDARARLARLIVAAVASVTPRAVALATRRHRPRRFPRGAVLPRGAANRPTAAIKLKIGLFPNRAPISRFSFPVVGISAGPHPRLRLGPHPVVEVVNIDQPLPNAGCILVLPSCRFLSAAYRDCQLRASRRGEMRKSSVKTSESICPACNGTGFPKVTQPLQLGRKIYPVQCKDCGGKGRIRAAN